MSFSFSKNNITYNNVATILTVTVLLTFIIIIMERYESEAPPSKRRRYESLGPVDIYWPQGVEPTYADELKLRNCLILGRHETGKGSELPIERQIEIEQACNELGIPLSQALVLRQLYMKQLTRGMPVGDECDIDENRDFLRQATEQLLRFQYQVHITTRYELELGGHASTPDFVIPDGGCIINGQVVNWIECIVSYGAASLAKDPHLYISTLCERADAYCSVYGPGAYVFLFGFSRDLMRTLGLESGHVLFLGPEALNTKHLMNICFPSHEGLCHEEIECSNDRAGLIIGPGGHTIRELMAHSGCDIVVHRADMARPCKVVLSSSSIESIDVAKTLIEQVLRSTEQFSRRVLCPLSKVGIIIGKQGSTVTEIMRLSHCSIKTHKGDLSSDGQHQLFVVCGPSEDCVLHAESLMNAVMKSGRAVLEKIGS
jgi:hypothetical protein